MGPGATVKPQRKPSRTKLVVLSGVSVVALAVGVRLMSSGPQSAPAASVATLPNVPPGGAVAVTPTRVAVVPLSVTWPSEVARDPFRSDLVYPPPAPAPKPDPKQDEPVLPPAPPPIDLAALAREKLQLKATVLGDRPLAMMNGSVYRVGAVVEGFRIVEIAKNQITIERDGTRLVLEVQ